MHLTRSVLAGLFTLSLTALPVAAEPPQILADMPVTASLIQQVLGDLGTVELLLDEGSDPHDFQLRPSQARALDDADLLIWVGPELTPWLTRAAEQRDPASSLSLLHLPGTHLRSFEDDDADDHDHDHAEDHHDHSHGGTDPHAWLDPENGAYWLNAIADRLATADPQNAETYSANAASAISTLETDAAAIREMLTPARDKPIVVLHDAYGYFTESFDLPDAIAVSLGDATSPSAARLRDVQAEIAASDAVCAFPEVNQPPRMIESAIEGTGLAIGAPLSPSGLGLPAGKDLYNNVLTEIGRAISACISAEN